VRLADVERPLAIAMWDFSWLERRWPGAGYEDWDRALDELGERGYDAVRIDAYPHLVAAGAEREWELLPIWNQHAWGSPAPCRVRVQPELNRFIAACGRRGIHVALSSWFRQDRDDVRMRIGGPDDLAASWEATLSSIAADGLLDQILYVDLCNEFPVPAYTPFLYRDGSQEVPSRTTPELTRWMADAIAAVRAGHPELDLCFSFCTELGEWRDQDVSFMDLLEPHVWMAFPETSDFYPRIGYELGPDSFDPSGYERLARLGEQLYRSDPAHWRERLGAAVDSAAAWSRAAGKPLVTTEGWAVVTFKDWPGLDWGWVKELCEVGVDSAVATGRWAAVTTSNFCGPQFVGMWRDVEWHRRLTDRIHEGARP
jgi:hypothetical protein